MKKSPLVRRKALPRGGPLRPRSTNNSARRKDPAIRKVIKDSKASGSCALCGAEGYLEGHHVLSRGAYPEMVDVAENIMPVCKTCHDFVTLHPRAGNEAIDETFPGYRDRLKVMARERRK